MNYTNKLRFKHHSLTKLALLLVIFTLFFSNLSAQNGGETPDTIKVKKPVQEEVIERTNEPEIFVVVEDMPEFPGGVDSMMKFIARNMNYPTKAIENKIEGRVHIQFIIDETGNLIDAKVLRGIGWGCDEEAIRVVNSMPKWTPGTQRNKPVKVRFVLPIRFILQ